MKGFIGEDSLYLFPIRDAILRDQQGNQQCLQAL